jgi:hypothetical protein
MTYQAYPTGGAGNQMPSADRPSQPASLRNAVRLMWGGAGLALLGTIISLTFSGKIRTAATNAAIKANATARSRGKTVLTTAQIHTLANATVAIFIVLGIVGVLLWVWMAWANNRGRSWARIVATVLFVLYTISFVLSISRASVSLIFIALEWLAGVGAIVLLWRRDTTEFMRR